MFSRALQIRVTAVAVISCAAWGCLNAQVASRSPFMPVTAAGAAPVPTAGAPLEFRGYMDAGDGLLFRLFDPARKTGVWLHLNEKNDEFEVVAKQHDPAQKTLAIEHQGRTLTLAMREAKVVSSGNAAQMIPPPPPSVAPAGPPNVGAAVTQTVVLNPTPADEQRRLEAVAAEVARRRALREQATQQISQGNIAPQKFMPPGLPGAPGGGRPPGMPHQQAR